MTGKCLHIQVGVKLSTALNEVDYSVHSNGNAAKFIADMTAFKNDAIKALKSAIELVLNIAPTNYICCGVMAVERDDILSVHVMPDFSEEEDGNYDKWLTRNHIDEEKLSKDIESCIQLVQNIVNNYGHHFGSCLLSLSTY